MKKTTMAAAGIVTALSVAAATGLMMGGSVKRMAQSAAQTMEDTGKRMGRMAKNAAETVEQTGKRMGKLAKKM